jgi:hypothetical protein
MVKISLKVCHIEMADMVEHHIIYLHCVTAICITKITIVPWIVNGV